MTKFLIAAATIALAITGFVIDWRAAGLVLAATALDRYLSDRIKKTSDCND